MKSPRPDGFIGKFYEMFIKELTSILYNLLWKTEKDRTLLDSFYEGQYCPGNETRLFGLCPWYQKQASKPLEFPNRSIFIIDGEPFGQFQDRD